jgi:hypothetical protein
MKREQEIRKLAKALKKINKSLEGDGCPCCHEKREWTVFMLEWVLGERDDMERFAENAIQEAMTL